MGRYSISTMKKLALFFSLFFLFGLGISSAKAVSTNTLIKASGPAVYYLADDEKRYVFPNQKIYLTWYQDFSTVQTISDAELASYQIGGNIFYRPGTRMVKITTDPKVYAVGLEGTLYPVASEQAAIALFGSNWNTKIDDLPDAFFTGYSIQNELDGSKHAPGTIFQYEENQNEYYYLEWQENGTPIVQVFNNNARNVYRFQEQHLVRIPSSFNYNAGINKDVNQLAKPVNADPVVAPPPPTSSEPGVVSVIRRDDFGGTSGVVEGTQATLYSVSIFNNSDQPITMDQVGIEFYIDAFGGEYEPPKKDEEDEEKDVPDEDTRDFLIATDTDENIERGVTDILTAVQLVHHETGEVITPIRRITNSRTTLTTDVIIDPQEIYSLDVNATIQTALEGTRLSADFYGNDFAFSSPTNASFTVETLERYNGGENPGVITTPVEHGFLTVSSTIVDGNGIYLLDDVIKPYTLRFLAQGEPFIIDRLQLMATDDGEDYVGIDTVQTTFKDASGVTKTVIADTEGPVFTFSSLNLFVPKNEITELVFSVIPFSATDEFSGSRIQFEFVKDNFFVESFVSERTFTSTGFLHDDELIDSTAEGSLIILRQSLPSFLFDSASPSGQITRFNESAVLQFQVSAVHDTIELEQLSFEIDSSDAGNEGINNDLLENMLDLDDNDAGHLALIGAIDGQETRLLGPQTTYTLVSKTAGKMTESNDYESTKDDYGLLTFDFGLAPYRITKGNTATFLLRLNTTTVSIHESANIRISLLSDEDETVPQNANFQWDDGSDNSATGYLIPGLPVVNSVSLSRITQFDP